MLQRFFNILNRDMQDADQMAENGLKELKKKRELSIGSHKVKIDRKIAEGGYADIYRVLDNSQSQSFFSNAPKTVFALKRQFIETDSQTINFNQTVSKNSVQQAYISEINSLKVLGQQEDGCQNVVRLVGHQENKKVNGFEVYMLLEFCSNGTLFDLIEQKCRGGYSGITDEDELIQIVNDVANGLKSLHEQSISHRDLKIENILKSQDGKWKICDLGSSTIRFFDSDQIKNHKIEITEEIEKMTTPIYRAPEQLDLFSGFSINEKVDIWALGCITYTLMYHKPPFEEGQKLSQINGKYSFQPLPKYSEFSVQLVKAMLSVNPQNRPSAIQIYQQTQLKLNNSAQIQQFQAQPSNQQFKFASSVSDQNQFQSLVAEVPQSQMNTSLNLTQQPIMPSLQYNKNHNPQLNSSLMGSHLGQSTQYDFQGSNQGMSNRSNKNQYLTKLQKHIDEVINVLIKPTEEGVPEKVLRGLIQMIDQQNAEGDAENNSLVYEALIRSVNNPSKVLDQSISALKFLVVSQKLFLYIPSLSQHNFKQILIHKKMFSNWEDILSKQLSNANDQFRCTYFSRLIMHLSSYIGTKIQMCQDFEEFIDTGLNIKGIIHNTDFKTNMGGNTRRSPLRIQFLNRLNLLWSHLTVLNKKILEKPFYLAEIRYQICLSLLEEQCTLMGTLSHLFLAFQITTDLFSQNLAQALKLQVNQFISSFRIELHKNVESLSEFVLEVKKFPELSHLSSKMPEVPLDICFVIDDLKEKFVNNFKKENKSLDKISAESFQINQILNIDASIQGKKVPIPFKTYAVFATKCHEKYDFVQVQQSFRDKLGQQYQAILLKKDYYKSNQPILQQPQVQVNESQDVDKSNFQTLASKFRSVTEQEFSAVMDQVKRDSKIQRSQYSSNITIQYRNDNQDRNMSDEKFNKKVFKSIEQRVPLRESLTSSELKFLGRPEQNVINLAQNQVQKDSQSQEVQNFNLLELSMDKKESTENQSYEDQLKDIFGDPLWQQTVQQNQQEEQNVEQSQIQGQGQGGESVIESQEPVQPQVDQNQNQDQFLMQWDDEYGAQQIIGDSGRKNVPVQNNQSQMNLGKIEISPMNQNASEIFKVADTFILNEQIDKQGFKSQGDPSSQSFHTSQFDSRASDYFLLLNQKNKSMVKKRKNIKMNYTDDVLEYDLIFAELEKQRVDKETELMKAIQEEQLKQQKIVLESLQTKRENEEKIKEQQHELQRLKTQFDDDNSNMKNMKEQYENQQKLLLQIEQERNKLEEDKQKFEEHKKEQQQKIDQEKDTLNEIQRKLKIKQQLQEQEAEKAEQIKKQQDERQKQLDQQINQKSQAQWQCVVDEEKGTIASYDKYINDQIEAFHLSEKSVGAELQLGQINNNNYKIVFEGMVVNSQGRQVPTYIQKNEETGNNRKIQRTLEPQKPLQIQDQQKTQELEDKIKELQLQLDKKTQEALQTQQEANTQQIDSTQSTDINSQSNSNKWQPDINNKEKNLAVQFLEHTLKGREFQNLDLREITNPKQIGEGAAALVYKAQYKFTDVAVKKLKAFSLIVNNKLSLEFQREVEALTQISHPNLVLFMGATADQGHPVIVTEFCHGGTLFEVLHEKKKSIPNISYKLRWRWAQDIAKGLHFMHCLKPPLMHRDLKSLNLLLTDQIEGPNDMVRCKITDFGLTRSIQDESGMMTGQAGTFHWMAPEVLENQPYTQSADVYSFGIVLWEILAREPPFKNHTPHQIMYGVINHKERPALDVIPKECPKELIMIMRACWEQDPKKRPTMSDVCQGLAMLNVTN